MWSAIADVLRPRALENLDMDTTPRTRTKRRLSHENLFFEPTPNGLETGAVSSSFRNGAHFFVRRFHQCPWFPRRCVEFA
jgi:hypothetical protein